MTSGEVYVTRPVPPRGILVLKNEGLTVHVHGQTVPPTHDELCGIAANYDAVVCQLGDRIDADVLKAAARCRVFANCAVGYDNIDVAEATRQGIIVTNTPDVLTESVADLTWGLLLATARRLNMAEQSVRSGTWRGWGMLDFLGTDVYGKTLGVVGTGRIGKAVVRRAYGFSMRVIINERDVIGTHFDNPVPASDGSSSRVVALEVLLRESDFVTLHVPLTPQTHHLIDRAALSVMKPGAILINTSRGAIVDETAMIEALEGGRLGGAGLDVYEQEPLVPERLRRLPNVVLLPHIGSATNETRERMAVMAAENVVAVLSGRPAPNPVGN